MPLLLSPLGVFFTADITIRALGMQKSLMNILVTSPYLEAMLVDTFKMQNLAPRYTYREGEECMLFYKQVRNSCGLLINLLHSNSMARDPDSIFQTSSRIIGKGKMPSQV